MDFANQTKTKFRCIIWLIGLEFVLPTWWSTKPLSLSTIHSDHVEITQLYEEKNRIRLLCDARGVNVTESLVLLACPSVKSGVCRENCIAPCIIIKGSPDCSINFPTPIESCRYRVLASDHVQVYYNIRLTEHEKAGKWWCMFRGQSSNPVLLQYQFASETVLNHVAKINLANTERTIKTAIQSTFIQNSQKLDVPRNQTGTVKFSFVNNIPFEMLFIIVACLCLSLTANVLLLIRCCVMTNYLKNLHNGKERSVFCDHILCVDSTKFLRNRSHAKYKRIPDHKLCTHQLPYNMTAGSKQTVSPILNDAFRPQIPVSFYSATGFTPFLLRNVAMSKPVGYENQTGMELIYDDVNHSNYTTVTPAQNDQLSPVLSTPDGRNWVLDQSGCVYLPCAQPAKPVEQLLYGIHVSSSEKNQKVTLPSKCEV